MNSNWTHRASDQAPADVSGIALAGLAVPIGTSESWTGGGPEDSRAPGLERARAHDAVRGGGRAETRQEQGRSQGERTESHMVSSHYTGKLLYAAISKITPEYGCYREYGNRQHETDWPKENTSREQHQKDRHRPKPKRLAQQPRSKKEFIK